MSTNYSFLDKNKKQVFISTAQPCFGSLFKYWKATKEAQYLRYLPIYSSHCKREKGLRWVELGQEMDILPDDISAKELYTNGITIDMKDAKLTIGELYLKLTFMRWLREAPSLVSNVVTLVDEAGRDFWAAVCYCHSDNICKIDHALLPYKGGYPVGGHAASIERDLGLVMRMHQIAAAPRLADTRTVVDALKKNAGFYWNWQSKTVKPEKNLILKNKLMLLSSELHPLIYSGDVGKAEKMIKTFKLRDSSVVFE